MPPPRGVAKGHAPQGQPRRGWPLMIAWGGGGGLGAEPPANIKRGHDGGSSDPPSGHRPNANALVRVFGANAASRSTSRATRAGDARARARFMCSKLVSFLGVRKFVMRRLKNLALARARRAGHARA